MICLTVSSRLYDGIHLHKKDSPRHKDGVTGFWNSRPLHGKETA